MNIYLTNANFTLYVLLTEPYNNCMNIDERCFDCCRMTTYWTQ